MSSVESFKKFASQEYKFGFKTDIETDVVAKGLNEDIIRFISKKKGEPEFMLDYRLEAYRHWLTLDEPDWANIDYPEIDYQAISYYAAPKQKKALQSMDEVDPELRRAFKKLGLPLLEQKRLANVVAVDAIFDSVSVATTFQEKLLNTGVIFCPISEALQKCPELVRKYLGSVVPYRDNFFAALNAAVFTDGSFVYVPKNTVCPMELSTYFRINTEGSGQFERTFIICEENSSVSYIEGCTAPAFDSKQLHAAVVELVALDDAEIKYATVHSHFGVNFSVQESPDLFSLQL